MKAFSLLLVACLSLALPTAAQLTPDKAKRSAEILVKARQLDLLNMLLPLVLTKKQINDLLTLVEKARAKEKEVEAREADQMRAIETKIDAALAKGYDDGLVPSIELLREVNKLFVDFSMRRAAVTLENTESIIEGLKKTLNPGQLKAAANAIDPKHFDPNADPAKMSDDEKLSFFVRANLLDPLCYDVLLKMSKSKAGG